MITKVNGEVFRIAVEKDEKSVFTLGEWNFPKDSEDVALLHAPLYETSTSMAKFIDCDGKNYTWFDEEFETVPHELSTFHKEIVEELKQNGGR